MYSFGCSEGILQGIRKPLSRDPGRVLFSKDLQTLLILPECSLSLSTLPANSPLLPTRSACLPLLPCSSPDSLFYPHPARNSPGRPHRWQRVNSVGCRSTDPAWRTSTRQVRHVPKEQTPECSLSLSALFAGSPHLRLVLLAAAPSLLVS